jgi:hypothetical protein
VSALDSQIDDLYKGPLSEFTKAREALAKTLKAQKDDAATQVKALAKPTVVPWAVNQLYWQARPVYHGLVKAGEKWRAAQIAALKGRAQNLKESAAAHRKAISDAAATATRLAEAQGQHPAADTLGRMLEALSLTEAPLERPGRFTQLLQPSGFEALAGIPIKAKGADKSAPVRRPASEQPPAKSSREALHLVEKRRASEDRERRAAEQKRREALKKAEMMAKQAREAEERARKEWRRAKDELEKAERALVELQE